MAATSSAPLFRDRCAAGEVVAQALGQPEDLAGAALFLLSDQAKWITGQVWAVDGGMSAVRV